MPELRRNPLTGGWVVVAPERAARPDTFRATETPTAAASDPDCPFCAGNEDQTPPEVARTGEGDPEKPGWRVRVVPNLYPIVAGEPSRIAATGSRFHDAARAGGAHEVAILSPDHGRSLADLTGVEAEDFFEMLAARVRHHTHDGHGYVQVLVNHGRAAGASIEHPHAQLVAIDLPPPAVATEAHHIDHSRECPVCRAVTEDADRAAPLVVADSPAHVWCPWWSGVPFEIMIASRDHVPRFEHANDLGNVARCVTHALGLLRQALGDVPYNVVVHSDPGIGAADFHWHVHIWPRLTIPAGFEQGTGILVNQVPPEHAAASLRAAGKAL